MAQQYIDVKNQTMLWKLIQRSPQFINNTVRINREQWFGSVIKLFYEQITVSTFSIEELKLINQKTITYMLSDLKQIEQSQINPTNISNASLYNSHTENPLLSGDGLSSPDNSRTRSSVLLNTTTVSRPGVASLSTYNEQFNARQQEYTNMLKPPTQPIPNFGEKLDDDVITNMDELLEQQKKQREYDISQVIPPPITPSSPILPQPSTLEKSDNMAEKININTIYPAIQNLIAQIESMKKDIQFLMSNKISSVGEQREEQAQESRGDIRGLSGDGLSSKDKDISKPNAQTLNTDNDDDVFAVSIDE